MFKKFLPAFALMGISNVVSAQAAVSGKIADAKGNAIQGATVHVLNSNVIAITDAQGNFSISNIARGSYTIAVEAVGYAAKTVLINANQSLNIILTEDINQLDDITVSAEKKETALQQTPVSITSLSARQVQQYRLWNSKELTAIVPNLFSNNSGDDRNVTSIRGITTTSYDPAVTTYVDGVNQFSLDTYIPQLQDVERIEILRGPQGTLYGRNAMGGVINIITKQPGNTLNGFAEVNIGNHGQQRYNAGIRTPLIKDKLFFGAAAMFNKRDGFYTNEFNNTPYDKQQGIAGNYYLKFLPNQRWAITLNAKHQDNRNNGAFPLVMGVEDALSNPFKLSQNALAKMIDNTFNASLVINHSGNRINFSSQTAWQQNHRYYNAPLDGDFSPLDIISVINDYGKSWNNVKAFTQEIRFSSPANNAAALKWTAGAYFFQQRVPNRQATYYGADAGIYGIPDTEFTNINTSTGKNTGIAVFGQLNYAVTRKFEIIAGVRYDHESKKLSVMGEYEKEGVGSFVTLADTSAKANFNALSPKFGFNVHPSDNNTIFATYSRGYRTGGLTQLSSDPSFPPLYAYKPEYSNNIEAGIKNNLFNGRLRVNITAFLTYVTDAQVPTLILPDAITVTRNTGRLQSKGVELETSATPVKGLQLDYNVGYTNAKYKSLKVSGNGAVIDLNGNKQIFTPDVTSMLAAQYSVVLNQKQQLKIVARAEWFYIGATYFDLSNTIRQNPYQLLNTRVGISSKHADIFFWGRNMTDKKYIAYAYDFGAVHLADPRTYGVTLTARF
ncbi:TonB-dependent receptor [Panacibacter sp. DH6]|uniref:TonB-dependent receptor n=1 Tax=Panacibacter microcysteis TaxID=2793269 RepID=A0A931DZ83_9BACT|nr:TonB-dependent receptor [Panacibacter microcysteis]MBG9375667.1 TonB-dependent receptor [Panacibacter microcysteis]